MTHTQNMTQMNLIYEIEETENRLVVAKGEMGWQRDGLGIWD